MTNWILDNYLNVFTILGIAVSLATFITALTPNKRDDEIVGYLRKVLEFISLKLLNK